MSTTYVKRPSWYTEEDDSAWEKVKEAFRRDWQQTKHDFGSKVPDLNQNVGDTVSQATGSKPIPPANVPTAHPRSGKTDTYNEVDEPAYRYGYAASRRYGTQNEWDDRTERPYRHPQ